MVRRLRKTQRIPETIPVEVRLQQPDASDFSVAAIGVASDLSTRGIRLVSEKELSPGDVLQLAIEESRSSRVFHHEGTVRWSEPAPRTGFFLSGIEFTHTDTVTLEAWRRYVMSKLWPAPRWNDDLSFASDYAG
jgi:hypothetical protein